MIHGALLLGICLIVFPTTSVSANQERTAVRVSIGGLEVPAAAQLLGTVEQQRGSVDQARIRLAGLTGVVYAERIAPGQAVDIDAVRLDGSSIPIFRGEVISVESGFDQEQPFVLIRASGPSPRADNESPHALSVTPDPAGDAGLVAFLPRLSSTSSIQEVLVTGVDSSTGGPRIGLAVAPTILIGPGADESFGSRVAIDTARLFSSTDEANAFAASVLSELVATRISGEVLTDGSPEMKIGDFVEIEGLDVEFDGAYYVAGVTHTFGHDAYGGYSSVFRVRRADEAMFRIPAIDDEVLVAFEHGDLTRPFVVGSLWDCDSQSRSGRSDTEDPCRWLRWPW